MYNNIEGERGDIMKRKKRKFRKFRDRLKEELALLNFANPKVLPRENLQN